MYPHLQMMPSFLVFIVFSGDYIVCSRRPRAEGGFKKLFPPTACARALATKGLGIPKQVLAPIYCPDAMLDASMMLTRLRSSPTFAALDMTKVRSGARDPLLLTELFTLQFESRCEAEPY